MSKGATVKIAKSYQTANLVAIYRTHITFNVTAHRHFSCFLNRRTIQGNVNP